MKHIRKLLITIPFVQVAAVVVLPLAVAEVSPAADTEAAQDDESYNKLEGK